MTDQDLIFIKMQELEKLCEESGNLAMRRILNSCIGATISGDITLLATEVGKFTQEILVPIVVAKNIQVQKLILENESSKNITGIN